MRRYLKIAKWRANKQFQQQQRSWQPHKTRLVEQLKAIWFNLSTAQKLYLLALSSLIVLQSGWLSATITIIALVIEFWPKFNQLWHSLAGKALILIFYASIANFVLAGASGIVNDVTHVSASHFNYTHNFATLLYLPPWAMGITLGTLLLFQLFLPFYIFVLLLIKPFGSERVKFISQSYSPLLTAIVRFVLASVVFINLISFLDDKPPEEVLDNMVSTFVDSKVIAKESGEEQQKAVEELGEKLEQQLPENTQSSAPSQDVDVEVDGETAENLRQFLDTKGYFERSKRLIAMFAYSFEADSYSRCLKAENSKSVELNDYEIVQVTPDHHAEYGYRFEVIACDSPGVTPVEK